jgi:hypothetical protein
MSIPTADQPARVAERLRVWSRSGNFDDLWPGLSARHRLAALANIRAVAAAVLRDDQVPAIEAADEAAARGVGVAAFTAGMGPLLGWWVEEGRVEASPPVRHLLAAHLENGARRIAMLRRQTVALIRAMRDAGVDPILLKGMHTGTEFFPHPATRPASDIDLLVRPSEMARAAAVLMGNGFTVTSRSSLGRRLTWTHQSVSRDVHSVELDMLDNPWAVDLHEALERWYFRGTRRDLGSEVFETERCIEIESESVRVLDEPYLAAFLALHASCDLKSMQLVRLLELVWVIRSHGRCGRLSFGELDSLLQRTATGRFVYPALALVEELAPGSVDARLLRGLAEEVSPRMHRVLDEIRQAEMGLLSEHSLDFLFAWAVGPKELALNALEIVLPGDEALRRLPTVLKRRVGIVLHASGRKVLAPLHRARTLAVDVPVDGGGPK